jgi:hypothetical protein
VGSGFEFRPSHFQSHFVLVILEMGSLELFARANLELFDPPDLSLSGS